jgi:hypothetical protein
VTEDTAESEFADPQQRGDDRVAAIEERLERLEHAFDDLLARVDNVPDRE